MTSLLLRAARLVPVGIAAGRTPGRATVPDAPVDVRITDGVVSELGPGLASHGEDEVDAAGRFLLPGLWDRHVHWDQWAGALTRIDLAGTTSAADAVARLARILPTLPDGAAAIGFGHRSALWPRPATVAELDAVSGGRPVVLISGDAHNGWLNSRALELLGLPPRTGVLAEAEWFDVLPRLQELAGPTAAGQEEAFRSAARKGVVGVVDMEFGGPFLTWPERIAAGERRLRVRAATYPSHLDQAIELGLRTGDPLDGGIGLATMGPLKVISDGSLNTRTAYCAEPYADAAGLAHPRGVLNASPGELTELLARATAAGLDVAVHAIGDAAAANAIDAMAAAGARGSIEHVQLLARADIPRLASHGIVASVQPAHLLDDRDVAATCWPDRADRCFMTRSLVDAGVEVALGSDAPVSPLDPWLAMAAAVFRGADEREQWNPAEALTPAQALACSTDGRGTVAVGSPADLAVVESDPSGVVEPAPDRDAWTAAARLRRTRVALTIVGGRVTHLAL